MPNWCNNRVTISAGTVEEEEQLAKIKAIFEKDNPFQVIYPMPDFDKIPHPETGELPVAEEIKNQAGEVIHVSTRWADGTQDTRWYDWRVANWDTKWDINAKDVEWSDEHEDYICFEFDTAWAPPEGVVRELKDQFPDVSISWFYDEPGMEFAGYL